MAKILLVDDEKDIVEFFGRILQREKFTVFTATNGIECLEAARRERPDLILLDINMPEMDGGDVADKLSKDDSTKKIPIIFLSGMVTKRDEGNIKGRTFISKTSSREEIIARIRSVLGM